MLSTRVEKLLNAYFNRPLREYAQVISEIKASGGLTYEEVDVIKARVLDVDAFTIVRHAGSRELQTQLQIAGK